MTAIFEERSAIFNEDRSLRYRLDLRWDDERPPIAWIMMNPSIADENRDDPTIRRVKRFSACWGFGAALIFNLFPFRSPDPKTCKAWLDEGQSDRRRPYLKGALAHNRHHAIVGAREAGVVCCAWGAAPWLQPEAFEILELLRLENEHAINTSTVVCLGRTGGGFPVHPLARGRGRVPDDQTMQPLELPAP